ncbi:hypothetical protein WN51_07513 [Melipona quadrifasciata]|uniref:Uncharacterized protein n=1 Tax=Melipona quadrifasciata TaxID=166423 RepID=A0A0N0U6S2_9HYME|nr:hypothetical protein WN51_07513 [Melipona quadrifasciata]
MSVKDVCKFDLLQCKTDTFHDTLFEKVPHHLESSDVFLPPQVLLVLRTEQRRFEEKNIASYQTDRGIHSDKIELPSYCRYLTFCRCEMH